MIEATLEVAIAKQLGLNPLEGSIVTAGMQFKARATTLRALLERDSASNAAAIATLCSIQKMPDRNDIMHGIGGINEAGLFFYRRKTDNSFKSTEKLYNATALAILAAKVSLLAAQLRGSLELSDRKCEKFFHTAHKDQIKRSK